MKDEYIIINKTAIQKRIEELEKQLNTLGHTSPEEIHAQGYLSGKIQQLREILSQSTPLIPVLEDAFEAGRTVKNYKGEWQETYSDNYTSAKYEESKDYISNLKLDI